MPVQTSALDVRDQVLELADRFAYVAALDPAADRDAARSTLGPRVPPGVQEFLDADEVAGALADVESWAGFVGHVLVDELDVALPDDVPGRLAIVASNVRHFVEHDDELLAASFRDDVHNHLRAMRRLARRSLRQIRTGIACHDPGCRGRYVAPVGGPDRHDDALECDRCHHRVPFSVWSSWPRARIKYVTVEHAARIAGTSVDAVKQRASRGHWRRVGTGRDVRYHVDDVRATSA